MAKMREKYVVDMVKLSQLKNDTKTGLEYGDVFEVDGMMDFSRTASENSTKVFYDGRLGSVVYDATTEELELSLYGIAPDVAAKMWNDEYNETTGQYIKVPNAPRPYFALQARNGYTNDPAHRYFTYYKISLAELTDEQIKGMSDSYSHNPLKVKATVLETEYKEERTTALGDKVNAALCFHSIDDDVVDGINWETKYFEKVNKPSEITAICEEALNA